MSKSNNSKAEVVLIIGNDLPKDEIQKEIQNKFPGFEDKIIFLGNGEIINSEFDLSPLQSRTNENTLFILYTHGIIDDGHIPSGGDIATGIFLQNLQNKVGHKIVVAADSCRVGKMLKINEIESDKISVLAEAGSSYQTLTVQNTKSVIESVSQKLSGRNNLEILSRKIGSRPETLYFLPFENKILSGPESKLDADYKAEIKRPGYKFSRPGKFTLDEIKEILRSVYEDKKVITTHLQKFINTNKFDFSINKIKQILELTDEDLETKDSDKLKFKNDLLEKFREKLQNKFTEKSIITFFKARRDKFNKITKINNQTDFEKINYREVIADFWFMAALRNYDEEISAILKNYPDFINIENNRGYVENGRGYTALKYAADDDNFEVVKILIAAGADVNWADNDGQSILMYAAASTMNRYGFSKDETKARVVKSLIRAGAKIDTVDKDGRSALIWAIKKGNTAIVMTLIENEADISLIDKDGWPALLYVAASKDMILRGTGVEILEKLIQAKVDVNFCDRNGKSVLTYAIEATNWPVVLQLINARAIEKDDDLILINIIKNIDKIGQGNFIGISLTRQAIKLIEAGARTDTVDKDGKSALILATEKNFLEIVDTLVKAKNVVHQEMFFFRKL